MTNKLKVGDVVSYVGSGTAYAGLTGDVVEVSPTWAKVQWRGLVNGPLAYGNPSPSCRLKAAAVTPDPILAAADFVPAESMLGLFPATQQHILAVLYMGGKRSDELGKALGISAANAAYFALGLRDKGLVSSTNDGEKYNLWSLTEKGQVQAKLVCTAIISQQRTKEAAALEAAKPKVEYILWSPQSSKPPKVRHRTYDDAAAVAKNMARSYPGHTFHICEVQKGFKTVKKTVEKVVKESVNELVEV